MPEKGIFQYHNNECNSQMLSNTVTAVTTPNTSKVVNYNIVTDLPDNLYRLYERGDKWACKKCDDTGR